MAAATLDAAQIPPKTASSRRRRPPRKVAVVAGLVVLALATAGWFLLRPAQEPHAEEPVAGPVTTLEPITMNLADGRLLKVGLALQLPEAGEGHGGGEVSGALALDEAITHFSGKTYDQLITAEGRAQAKAELSAQVAERYHGDVLEVYFTQFLMQ